MTVRVLALLSHVRHTTFSYELSNRINERTDADVTVVSYEDASLDEVEEPVDGTVDVVPLGARSRFDRRAIARLRKLLTSGEYDLLHTHHNFVGSLGRFLAPSDLTIVDSEHGNHRDHYSTAQNLVNAATLWRADRVVANSDQTRRSFYRYEHALVSPEQVAVIYDGIDVDRIDRVLADSSNPYATDRRRILAGGRMVEVKNLGTVVRAFAYLSDQLPDVELTLVGDGPRRTHLETLVATHGLEDRVRFTGFVPRADMYRLFASSEVFVVPSFSEGFCCAAAEAMACGSPVVASDIDVLREVIGTAGAFADPENPITFADGVRTLLEDEAYRNDLAEKACTRARSRFSLDKAADEYYRVYTQLV